jgi:DNA-binding transcriptional LysR family regulator
MKEVKITLINGNTEQIEKSLLEKEIEVGIVEGQLKNKGIKYTPFLKDELVLVCKANHSLSKKNEITKEDLLKMQFLMREQGSGTLEVIEYGLKTFNVSLDQLDVQMQLGSTESIKSYLLNSNCVAFISIHAVSKELKNNQLTVLDIKNLSIERNFYIVTLQGKSTALVDLLITDVLSHYNFKL